MFLEYAEKIRAFLADGEWHSWRAIAGLADRNLGAELLLAATIEEMRESGELLYRKDSNSYRMPV